jgi:SAM-dependent methyltransferase
MNSEISSIYCDGTYLRGNPTWHVEDSRAKACEILGLLERNRVQPSTVCEIGCGAGEVLRQLSRQLGEGVALDGYEPSPQAFELCRQRQEGPLHFHRQSLPPAGSFYDLLLVIDVVEHVEDYMGFLKELKVRGRHKIFRVPLNLSVQSVLLRSRPILNARRWLGHLHYFTAETVVAVLEDLGYRIIDRQYAYGPMSAEHIGRLRYIAKGLKRAVFSFHEEWVARLLDGFTLLILAE